MNFETCLKSKLILVFTNIRIFKLFLEIYSYNFSKNSILFFLISEMQKLLMSLRSKNEIKAFLSAISYIVINIILQLLNKWLFQNTVKILFKIYYFSSSHYYYYCCSHFFILLKGFSISSFYHYCWRISYFYRKFNFIISIQIRNFSYFSHS